VNDEAALVDCKTKPRDLLSELVFGDSLSMQKKESSDQGGRHDTNMLLKLVDQSVAQVIVEVLAIGFFVEWIEVGLGVAGNSFR